MASGKRPPDQVRLSQPNGGQLPWPRPIKWPTRVRLFFRVPFLGRLARKPTRENCFGGPLTKSTHHTHAANWRKVPPRIPFPANPCASFSCTANMDARRTPSIPIHFWVKSGKPAVQELDRTSAETTFSPGNNFGGGGCHPGRRKKKETC